MFQLTSKPINCYLPITTTLSDVRRSCWFIPQLIPINPECISLTSANHGSMEISGSKNGGIVPSKAIFWGDLPLYRPEIYSRYERAIE